MFVLFLASQDADDDEDDEDDDEYDEDEDLLASSLWPAGSALHPDCLENNSHSELTPENYCCSRSLDLCERSLHCLDVDFGG